MEIKLNKKNWQKEFEKLLSHLEKEQFAFIGTFKQIDSFQMFADTSFCFAYQLNNIGVTIGKVPEYYVYSNAHIMDLNYYKYKLHDKFIGCKGFICLAYYDFELPASIDKKQAFRSVEMVYNPLVLRTHPLDQMCFDSAIRLKWAYYAHTLPDGRSYRHKGITHYSPFDNPL